MVYLCETNRDYRKVLVFWKEKLVLLAVPKTGTTAIETALAPSADVAILNPPGLKHTTLHKYDRFVQPYFMSAGTDDLETAAVVRNPLDWLGSWYRYRSRPYLDGKPNSTRDVSFDQFVLEVLKDDKAPYARIGSQLRFLTGKDGSVGATHMFQFEDLSRYVSFLEKRLTRRIDLRRQNVSPEMELPLSPDIRKKLDTEWAAEFDLWRSASQASET